MCKCKCVRVFECVHVCVSVYLYTCVLECDCVDMVCLRVCIIVCVCKYVSVSVRVCECVYVRM